MSDVLMRKIEHLEAENREMKMLAEVTRYAENGIIIVNAEGEIEWVNPGFTGMTGFTLESLKKIRGNTIFEASYSMDIIPIFNSVVMFKRAVTYDTYMFTKYGRKIWVSSLITPVFERTGELQRFIIIDTDITKYQRKNPEMAYYSTDLLHGFYDKIPEKRID